MGEFAALVWTDTAKPNISAVPDAQEHKVSVRWPTSRKQEKVGYYE